MTVGNPMRLILVFAVPLFIGSVFQTLYNMVDAVVVGRFVSAQALAAVGAASPAYNLFFALINGFTNGASIILSQYFGDGDRAGVRKGFATSVVIVGSTGAVFTVAGYFLAGPLLSLLGTPGDVYADSLTYMRFMAIGILATCLYNGLAAAMRSLGNSGTPLVALIIASLLNIVLDLVFVLAFGWGVAGVAAATIIAQGVSGLYCLFYIRRRIPDLALRLGEIRPDRDTARETVRLGLPAAFSTGVVMISVLFIQHAVNSWGSTVVAAYTADSRAENIFFCLSYAIGQATGVFIAQNRGAGQMERVRKGLFDGIRISLVYHVAVGILAFSLGRYIVGMFSTDGEVIRIGSQIIRITACFAPVLGLVFIFQNFLRSVSDVTPTIWMSCAEVFSRGVLPFVLSARFGYFGIWWATPIGWSLSLLIGVLRFGSGRWKEQRRLGATEGE